MFKPMILFSAFLSLTANAELVRGTLTIEDNIPQLRTAAGEVLNVVSSDKLLVKRVRSHARGNNYILEFDGEREGSDLKIESTPVIYGDHVSISGRLDGNLTLGLSIDGIPARYGRTKPIYNVPFDELSKNHFIGKEVITQGHYEDDSFVITSIIEDNLLTAGDTELTPINQGHRFFEWNSYRYILKEMPKNKNSQSKKSFRGIVHQDDNYQVTPGEGVLIMTLSGRQGDSIGAAGGHYGFGMGIVQDDEKRSIKGEIFNFYFEGEKEILAGNTDLNNYFGHLIQGQQNYRPTYTIFFYGVPLEMLKEAKKYMEVELERVRTEKGLEITQYYNCVTSSISALRKVGINGNHWHWPNPKISTRKILKDKEGTLKDLAYLTLQDLEEYVPRNAIESFLIRYSRKGQRSKVGIKRIDYIFMPQTPSKRPLGGTSYNDLIEGYKVIKNMDKDLDQKAIDKILNSIR